MAGTKSDIFFWSDWLSDIELGSCSLAAQGAWMRLLCVMATSKERGRALWAGKAPSDSDLMKLLGVPLDEANALVAELINKGVCSKDRRGVLYNRRMVRADQKARSSADGGKKGGRVTYEKKKGIFASQGGTQPPMARDHSHSHNQKDSSSPSSSTISAGAGVGSHTGSFGGGGAGGQYRTSLPIDQRMTIFAGKIAHQINITSRSSQGSSIVAAAQDQSHPDHQTALKACKSAATALGKGWPRYWPTNRTTHR